MSTYQMILRSTLAKVKSLCEKKTGEEFKATCNLVKRGLAVLMWRSSWLPPRIEGSSWTRSAGEQEEVALVRVTSWGNKGPVVLPTVSRR